MYSCRGRQVLPGRGIARISDDAFAKLPKANISCILRLSVRPHWTRLPLDGYSCYLILEYFSKICPENSISIHLSIRFVNSCRHLPETKRHSSLFLHWSGSKFLVVMAACTPSIHVFLGRPLFHLSSGNQSIINFDIPLASFWRGHTIVVFSSLWCPWCPASLSLPLFPLYIHFLFFPSLIFLLTSLAHPFL